MSQNQKNKSLSNEQLQLLACLKAYIAGGRAETVIDLNDERSVGSLFSLAYFHKLIPVVGHTLVSGTPAAETETGKMWMQTAKKQAVMQAYLADTFCSFYKELSARGFSPLVLKGELCRRLYERPELRLSSDEDMLAPDEEFEGCVNAMLGMGFVSAQCSQEGGIKEENGVVELNSPDGLHIELHKRLFEGERAGDSIKAHFLSAASCTKNGEGPCVLRCFAPTDELLYLICHAAKHFTGGGFGVRTAADIAVYAMRYYDEIDFNELSGILKRAGCYGFACAVFDIAVRYFGLDPERYAMLLLNSNIDGSDMLADCLAGGVYGTATKARAQSAKYTRGAAGGVSNTKTKLKALFPAASELEEEHPYLKKSRLLLPAAWAGRIFKYLRSGRKDAQSGARLGRERTELLKQYGLVFDRGSQNDNKR